jgi:MFS family permease
VTTSLGRLVPPAGPVRSLALVTLVNTTGNGVFFTLSALYFTRIVGLSVAQVGLGLGIAAFVGLFAGVPVGHLADRRGPREVMVGLLVVVTVLALLLILVTSFLQFVVVASALSFFDRGAGAVRGGLIAGLATGGARASTKAYLRSVTNVGMTVGTGIAAVALHFDTRAAYLVVLLVDVASYAASALLMLRVPHVAPRPASAGTSMFLALRDWPFVSVTLVGAVLAVHYQLLEVAMPLWVVEHTTAPRSLVAVLVVLNTGVVIGCQVLVARRVTTPAAAVRASVLSGVLFLLCCVAFGASAGRATAAAVLLLVVAMVLQVLGELWQAAGSFVLGFELAPDHAQGQYQGLYGMGMGISTMIGPPLMALLPLGLGVRGWWILGGLLLAAALALKPVVSWCEATRPRYADVVPVS